MAVQRLGDMAVGTVVKLNESGAPVEFIVVQQGSPSEDYVGFENGTTVIRKDIHSLGVYNYGTPDYANSVVNSWCNETYFNIVDLHDQIMSVKIPYRPGAEAESEYVAYGENGLSCKVFLPSFTELGGSDSKAPDEGVAFSYFNGKPDSQRISEYNGENYLWMTRSPVTLQYYYPGIWAANSEGNLSPKLGGADGGSGYGTNQGRRPAFVIPQSLYVLDDGTVTDNQLPTAPGSIAATNVLRGQTATITLTAATDPDGTVESYIYERQVDGGEWTQFADVNALTQTDTIGEEWGTVAYRACAVDDKGVSGPCVTSETFTVNSGWTIISGPAESMGSKPAPFDFVFSVSVTGEPDADAITVSAALDGEQVYSGTPSAGEQVTIPIKTHLLGAGTHTIEVQASKDDYLPASKRYTFTVPAVTIPDGGVGAMAQGPDGRAVYHTTLAQRCIGRDGVDIQAQMDALAARVKTLEG